MTVLALFMIKTLLYCAHIFILMLERNVYIDTFVFLMFGPSYAVHVAFLFRFKKTVIPPKVKGTKRRRRLTAEHKARNKKAANDRLRSKVRAARHASRSRIPLMDVTEEVVNHGGNGDAQILHDDLPRDETSTIDKEQEKGNPPSDKTTSTRLAILPDYNVTIDFDTLNEFIKAMKCHACSTGGIGLEQCMKSRKSYSIFYKCDNPQCQMEHPLEASLRKKKKSVEG